MNWSGGNVPASTTRKNLLWFWAIAALLAFHGCAWLAWQSAQDEAETAPQIERVPE